MVFGQKTLILFLAIVPGTACQNAAQAQLGTALNYYANLAASYSASSFRYDHKTSVCATGNTTTCPSYQLSNGICQSQCTVVRTDCSGLGNYLLQYALAPVTNNWLNVIKTAQKINRPTAASYAGFFRNISTTIQSGSLFVRIARVADLQKGDMLGVAYNTSGSTGHFMFVMAPPLEVSSSVFSVWIMDSSNGVHSNDTRKAAGCTSGCGLGTGTIYLQVDTVGAPINFYWSNPSYTPVSGVTAFGMGRVLPLI